MHKTSVASAWNRRQSPQNRVQQEGPGRYQQRAVVRSTNTAGLASTRQPASQGESGWTDVSNSPAVNRCENTRAFPGKKGKGDPSTLPVSSRSAASVSQQRFHEIKQPEPFPKEGADQRGRSQQEAAEGRYLRLLGKLKTDELKDTEKHAEIYNGQKHGSLAHQLKSLTQSRQKPFTPDERNQLMPLMASWKKSCNYWNWMSLAVTLHSLTSSGLLTLSGRIQIVNHQAKLTNALFNTDTSKCRQSSKNIDVPVIDNLLSAVEKRGDDGLKLSPELEQAVLALQTFTHQVHLLNALLNAVTCKCLVGPPLPDAQGIVNLLWAMAKLVDNRLGQADELTKAVNALLPRIEAEKDHFIPQHIANLMWAMAKLVDAGLVFGELTKAVNALLPRIATEEDHFVPQGIANLMWAMAKLVDNRLQVGELTKAVNALLPRIEEEKDYFKPQGIANLMWAMAKLVDAGLVFGELTKTVNALLPRIPRIEEEKDHFKPQEIANLMWAMAKLVDAGLVFAELTKAVNALLSRIKAEKDHFIPQAIANLLWAMAKLVDAGLVFGELTKAVNALLPRINKEKDHFIPQGIANLLWAMAKLVDNRLVQADELTKAVNALLPRIDAKKDYFKLQEIANLMWAMAKLVDAGLVFGELTKAVNALLLRINKEKDHFIPQGIANLLWAMAKLVDNRLVQTGELTKAVNALLPRIDAEKDHFIPKHIANLMWAMVKLVDNRQVQAGELTKAVNALLPRIKAEKDHFIPQAIANLLWAMAKMGEAIKNLEGIITGLISEKNRLKLAKASVLEKQMSLWALNVFCAKLFRTSLSSSDRNSLQETMGDLFRQLNTESFSNDTGITVMAMAAFWLNQSYETLPSYVPTISEAQSTVFRKLKIRFPSEAISQEKSINQLPPVDIMFPDRKLVIEIQGPQHYIGGDYITRNGSTILKIASYEKLGYRVIEFPAKNACKKKSCQKLNKKVDKAFSDSDHLKANNLDADEIYLTADEGLSSDEEGYMTADESL